MHHVCPIAWRQTAVPQCASPVHPVLPYPSLCFTLYHCGLWCGVHVLQVTYCSRCTCSSHSHSRSLSL